MIRTITRFLTLPILGAIGSIIGIGGGLKNLFGGGQQGGSKSSNTYVPTGLGGADQTWQNALAQIFQNLQGQQGATQPAMLSSLEQMLGLNTGGLNQAGQQAGQQYSQLSPMAQMYSQILGNQAGINQGAQANLMNAGNQLWQTAQDPNNALRDRLQQQVVDSTRAGDSARGIAMSPQSAGLESDATSQFLQNWQQQMLQRQQMGLQGMTSAYGQAGQQGQDVGSMLTGSLGLGAQAPGFTQQGGLVPFQMAQMGAEWPMQAAGMYNQGMSGLNSGFGGILSSIIPYLNSGQGATNQAFGQGQTGLNNLTSGLSDLGDSNIWQSLGNLFGGNPGYGFTTNYGRDTTSVGPPAPGS